MEKESTPEHHLTEERCQVALEAGEVLAEDLLPESLYSNRSVFKWVWVKINYTARGPQAFVLVSIYLGSFLGTYF